LHFDLISIWNATSVAIFSRFRPVPPQETQR